VYLPKNEKAARRGKCDGKVLSTLIKLWIYQVIIILNNMWCSYVQTQEMRIRGLTERLSAAECALLRRQSISQHSNDGAHQKPGHYSKGLETDSSDASVNTKELMSISSVEEAVDPTSNSEITDINRYTRSIEFHGSSSSVAILQQVQGDCGKIQNQYSSTKEETSSLISTLHNPGFSPQATATSRASYPSVEHSFYTPQANFFMAGYFDTLHHIHPIIDREDFNARARDLWLGRFRSSSFMALYYSVLSLGALVRVWEEEEILGMTRFEWSRKLFQEAQACLDESKFANNLDTVQCLFIMVRISPWHLILQGGEI
jgi:hypothetical protein